MTASDYTKGFELGIAAAVTLSRAGCSADRLATAIQSDPGRADPRGYCDLLGEIRRELGTDSIGDADD
jgi:hypothetical protein